MEDEFEIRQIGASDRLTGLSLGGDEFAPLKTFIQRSAKKYQEQSLARTYGVFTTVPSGKLVAYATLVCGEVVIGVNDDGLVDANEVKYAYPQYPAVKLARLAVDRRQQGRGIGQTLVQLGLAITKETISPAVGCRFLMVDAKRSSVSFYEKCGFKLLDTEDNRQRDEQVMFIDIWKLSE